MVSIGQTATYNKERVQAMQITPQLLYAEHYRWDTIRKHKKDISTDADNDRINKHCGHEMIEFLQQITDEFRLDAKADIQCIEVFLFSRRCISDTSKRSLLRKISNHFNFA